MNLTLYIWRQKNRHTAGEFVRYDVTDIIPEMSFLEMLDVLNEKLMHAGDEPIAFDHDCREGICGACGMMINGVPHGEELTTTCQLHMRKFQDGDTIYIEPWRATSFPVIKDLAVDRSAFDRIIQAGGYISIPTGSASEGNTHLISKGDADLAMDAASCIGCGACVAACPNSSAMLFTAAKVSHLGILPQGQPERYFRVTKMVKKMDTELFGSCTNHGECEEACPAGITLRVIAKLNRDLITAHLKEDTEINAPSGDS